MVNRTVLVLYKLTETLENYLVKFSVDINCFDIINISAFVPHRVRVVLQDLRGKDDSKFKQP
jgi:hypothetical protein